MDAKWVINGIVRRASFIAFVAAISCGGGSAKLPASVPTPSTYFTAERTDTTFVTADHFLASIEMQISGEPFAQLLGRNLAGYDRFNRTRTRRPRGSRSRRAPRSNRR